MRWFKPRGAISESSATIVEAATLMKWCEDWLPEQEFPALSKDEFRAIANLIYLSKVGFVTHWLDAASRRHELGTRPQEIMKNFLIIFDPDSYRLPMSDDRVEIAKLLADLGLRVFSLVDIGSRLEEADPTYYLAIHEWCTEWMTFAMESKEDIERIYRLIGFKLMAVVLGELVEIRAALSTAVKVA